MDTLKKSESKNSPSKIAGTNLITPPLDEVVAAIDTEISLSTEKVADEKEENQDAVTTKALSQKQFILFGLEGDLFALPLLNAMEVGHRPEITPLPNLPDWVLGISNIRGEIISLVNLKVLFGIPSSGTIDERRFIILYNQSVKVGVIVDEVPGILSLDEVDADIQKSPYRQGEIVPYISGVSVSEDRFINILDPDKLLSSLCLSAFEEG